MFIHTFFLLSDEAKEGRLVAHLERLLLGGGEWENNTIVVLMGDHGPPFGLMQVNGLLHISVLMQVNYL